MKMDRDDWLALTAEETLEPDLVICDPHHHFWDRPTHRYVLDELRADIESGHNVVSTVFIECRASYREDGPEAFKPIGETEFVHAIAEAAAADPAVGARVAAGIVGLADLTLGDDVAAVLEAQIATSPMRFRGIRHAAGFDDSDDVRNSHTNPTKYLLAEPAFRAGFARLAPLNMSFEGWLYHRQIPELTDLARAFPETTIILNHFGGPLGIGPYAGRRQEILDRWRRDITELAACENVVAKLGGLFMPINGFGFHEWERPPSSAELAEAGRPYHMHAIEKFGVNRCMFESNFPVDRASTSYNVLWNTFKRLVEGFSAAEKAALFHDTAARVYRLDT
jgi:predicted TIM-barrel fold metal-dependent hydrolase